MRNSGYRVIALTAAIGAAAAVLALTTHRDSDTDVAPAPGAPVAPAGTGVADPSSTPATTAGAATSGATPSWPAGSIVITGPTATASPCWTRPAPPGRTSTGPTR